MVQITDEGIQHLTAHCHDLRVLNVHSCSQLTDRTAENLSEGLQFDYNFNRLSCIWLVDHLEN